MAKGKSPSELNTRVIRVNIGDYLLLAEISQKLNFTMAEALHLVITEQAKREQVTIIPRTQIPMAAFRVGSVTSIAVNGSKHAAIKIKPRGGVIRE